MIVLERAIHQMNVEFQLIGPTMAFNNEPESIP